MRAVWVGALFVLLTPVLVALQRLIGLAGLPGQFVISQHYYGVLCRLLRLRVRVVGRPALETPLLIVANHVSWLDIPLIGALAPVVFVAKREVAHWPLIGAAARQQGTIFVDRNARARTREVSDTIATRLRRGHPVVLFAEGTSSDGLHVLPFRSGLIGATLAAASPARPVRVQPMSICYTGQHGMPLGRPQQPLVAWHGALDLVPHLAHFLQHGAVDAVVSFGEPIVCDGTLDRKSLTARLERRVRCLTAAARRRTAPTGISF
jgi:1-acyl-sn-glycerol-3-phosphate acyltransferase